MNIMNLSNHGQRAVPIPIATLPVFKHFFIVKEKICCNCYEDLFKIYKTDTDWIVERFCDDNKKFSIPITKMTPDIINILV